MSFPPIGILHTCFTEKFGVPRQSMMVGEARGILKLNPDPGYRTALNHLERFSHLWLIFVFHRSLEKKWRPTIQPPRVGAPRVGVFASRSPHRPNPLGLSAVQLDRIDYEALGGIEIHLSGVDILNETPVLDIKPYLPFADCIASANSGWAEGHIPQYRVDYSSESIEVIENAVKGRYPRLQELLTQMLEWDPRPTSQRAALPIEAPESEGKEFAFRLLDFDVKWQIRQGSIWVLSLTSL